jgi:hypothetical protein
MLDYWKGKIQMEEGPLGRPCSKWQAEYVFSNVSLSVRLPMRLFFFQFT